MSATNDPPVTSEASATLTTEPPAAGGTATATVNCLGQNLARAELEEAITFLATRLPGLRPASPARLGGLEGIYGIESLPLAWSAP
ncbi:MAG TPA: hypothetical protein VMV92_01425 [Streptosporangiaceae bacterium]|nr:hypothetical protein [Streptosporangiaceae bacterium]